MDFEIRAYYTRGFGYTSKLDKECSTPRRAISAEEAEQYMNYCERLGMRRHETNSQIFYDHTYDSNHTTEYIFYK